MFLDPFFEEIVNLAMKILDSAVAPAIPKIVFGGGRSRLGDLLQLTLFKVVLNRNLEGILNLEREI